MIKVNVYVMDIVWILHDICIILCMEVNIQQMVVGSCEKAFLRISYTILFEYKGPWKLQTDTLIF